MQIRRAAPDETSRQNLRNFIGQIEAAISNAHMDLATIVKEFDFLTENGTPEQIAIAKLDVGRGAVRLETLIPSVQALLDTIKKVAGEKAMGIAKTPIVFNV